MAALRDLYPGELRAAEHFGEYLVLGKIASGGMAEVHLACALAGPLAGQSVALKRMLPALSEQPGFAAIFDREALITQRIEHEHVCRVYHHGEVDGTCFIAMEYLHGASLGALLTRLSQRGRRLKLRFAAAIFDDVCAGLQAAHELGIVHRDVSPNNIFITTDGGVKLLDFGVAKASFAATHTRPGVLKGTFAYMSPEQLEGRKLDARADVFSLGVVMHEALTCRRLFRRANDYETCRAITREPIPRACDLRRSVPVGLSNAIDRALARRRQDRYPTVAALRDAWVRAVGEPTSAGTREVIGAEIARLFADELEHIDDLVAAQPTRVVPTREPTRPPAPPRDARHVAGDIIAALPLRPRSVSGLGAIDEAHPTEPVAALEDDTSGRVLRLPTASEGSAFGPRPAARRTRSLRPIGVVAVALAVALAAFHGGVHVLGSNATGGAAAVAPAVDLGGRADVDRGDAQPAAAHSSPAPSAAQSAAQVVELRATVEPVEAPRAAEPSEARQPRVRERKRRRARRSSVDADSLEHAEGPGARIAAEL